VTITVILCTYNRCETLPNALDSIAASTVPSSYEWEVLVVDNNSTDRTGEVVRDFCRRYPGRFRYVWEPRQGLSYARNAGIRESRGDVLAFMDDDVTVDPEWLFNLTSSLHNGEFAGAGGRIIPVWEDQPPTWLSTEEPHALAPFAAFDLGSEADRLSVPPLGANMAFRKEVFEKYGGFRTDLGRCADNLLCNEDTEFGRRLLIRGEHLRYEAAAVMNHPVYENRLQKKYLLAWWFDKGRADIRELGVPPTTAWFFCGVPLYLVRRLVAWTLRWMVAISPARKFSCKLGVWNIAGGILECYRQSSRSGPETGARAAEEA
jgi:glucosyl-dolichyl phosphate glucuronosyltransferase